MIDTRLVAEVNRAQEERRRNQLAKEYSRECRVLAIIKAFSIIAGIIGGILLGSTFVEVRAAEVGMLVFEDSTQNLWDYEYTYDLSTDKEWCTDELYVRHARIVEAMGDVEDWEVGDEVTLIMSDAGTYMNIYDDEIVRVLPEPLW